MSHFYTNLLDRYPKIRIALYDLSFIWFKRGTRRAPVSPPVQNSPWLLHRKMAPQSGFPAMAGHTAVAVHSVRLVGFCTVRALSGFDVAASDPAAERQGVVHSL